MQEKILRDLARFPEGSAAESVFGVSVYDCPRFGRKADNWTCKEKKEDCINQQYSCDVLISERSYDVSPLLVTNYSKFLKFRSADWDLIIIDDSHSFEAVKEQVYQNLVNYRLINENYERHQEEEILGNFLGIFCEIFEDIFVRALPPNRKQGTLGSDYVTAIAEEIFSEDDEQRIKEEIQRLPDREREICKQEFQFIDACKKAADYRFFVRKDWYDSDDLALTELIAREAQDTINFRISNRLRDARVILATATPGDPNRHAAACTHRNYERGGLRVVPETIPESLKDWFRNLDIFWVSDLGDTRTEDIFKKSLMLATEIIEALSVKTILLFKNYRDQTTAKDYLSGKFKNIYFIERDDDEDTIHEQANRARIILASASTRLWEGIDISDLRLGIIFTPPFIRVPVHILQTRSYPYNERIMLRRLQQGIGRLIRSEIDEGTCILLDEKFKRYYRRRRFSEALRQRICETNSLELMDYLHERVMR